jgi:hypothetical protein
MFETPQDTLDASSIFQKCYSQTLGSQWIVNLKKGEEHGPSSMIFQKAPAILLWTMG